MGTQKLALSLLRHTMNYALPQGIQLIDSIRKKHKTNKKDKFLKITAKF